MNNIHDIQQIKAKLAPEIETLVKQLYPKAEKEGGSYRVGSLEGEEGRSLKISIAPNTAGDFFDHATGESGSVIKLVATAKGIPVRQAIEWLAAYTKTEPIKSLETKAKEVDSEKLFRQLKPLPPQHIEQIQKERGISADTLEAYNVGRGTNKDILFPHYIGNTNKIGLLKHWVMEEKKIWSNPEPIHSLFGKPVCEPDIIGTEQLVIAEGQWDAMSLYEIGIPAVSIPSGVSNMDWIAEDYEFLNLFEKIVLVFDSDEQGLKAAKEAAFRLGEHRCHIVSLSMKDPNEMLLAGKQDSLRTAIESSLRQPLTGIVNPDDIKAATLAYCRGEDEKQGIQFFIKEMDFYFRPHEMTLFFAPTHAGKSTVVKNQMAYLSSLGEKCFIASFEEPPHVTMGSILEAKHCRPNLSFEREQWDAAFNELTQDVFLYESHSKTNPAHLLKTFEHAHKQHGICHFVIDNVMTLNVDRQDNTAQSNTADLCREFVANNPVHLYVVAHPRKPQEDPVRPPSIHEIQGASEWGNMPHNIFSLWRNQEKQSNIEQMRADGIPAKDIRAEWEAAPDGELIVRKQRRTGRLPKSPIYFHEETKRITRTSKPPVPFKE